jgi:hypothetical protein
MEEQQVVSSVVTVTDKMTDSMRSTKLWTKFLSIMGFIGTGFTMLVGIFIMFAGNLFPKAGDTGMTVVMGIFYMLFSVLYLIPSLYLFKYSSALNRFLGSKMESEMEAAFSYQKSFWKFMGILCLIGMILALIGIIAAILIPIMVGMGHKA